MEFDEEIREFLIESNENLAVLDQEIVELEHQPENRELIASIFRTIHSIKGTCGFFGYDILGSVTHLTESILVQLRDGQRRLTPELITLVLEAVDAVKVLLQRIEAHGEEGFDETEALRAKLEEAYRTCSKTDKINDLLKANSTQQIKPVNPVTQPVVELPSIVQTPDLRILPRNLSPDLLTRNAPISSATTALKETVTLLTEKSSPVEVNGELLAAATIRVDVNLLNHLMNLVGELVLTRNQLLQAAIGFSPAVQQTSQRLNMITSELQEGVMKTRMQPIGVIWNKLPRVVRDLSSKCGKHIQLEMIGAGTELDKSLIEAIRDPLTHIVRNSCDHGIETPEVRLAKGKPVAGTLLLRAFHEAGAVNIEISDDGAGIDPERVRTKALEKGLITAEQAATLSATDSVNLIFLPGFSTAHQVTSISGRGVGMDVVKTNIEKISGCVEIIVKESGGTIIRIKIPLTLAIIPGLVVSSNVYGGTEIVRKERFIIPQSHLVELTRVDPVSEDRRIEHIRGVAVFRHRGKLLPLTNLSQLFKRSSSIICDLPLNIVVLQVEGRHFGLIVDNICDTQEIVVKPLGRQLKHLVCYMGATIMGDGQPALILDVGGLAKLAGIHLKGNQATLGHQEVHTEPNHCEMLLFRAGGNRRVAIPLSVVHRLEEFSPDVLEFASGEPVVRYRGEILSLLPVSQLLGGEGSEMFSEEKLRVVVINNDGPRIGLVVDEIIDIVDESLEVMRSSTKNNLLSSVVIAGKVTDLLDIEAVRRKSERYWNRVKQFPAQMSVLLYDPSPLSREMTRIFLKSAGLSVQILLGEDDFADSARDKNINLLLVAEHKQVLLPEWLRNSLHRMTGVPTVVLTDTTVLPSAADKRSSDRILYLQRENKTELLNTLSDLLNEAKESLNGTHG